MQEKLLKQTAVFTAVFSVIAICLMVWFQWNREELLQLDESIVQTQQSDNYEEVVSIDTASGFISLNIEKSGKTNTVSMSFASEISNEAKLDIDYVNRLLQIHVPKLTVSELQQCQMKVDENVIVFDGVYAQREIIDGEAGVLLTFPLQGYFDGTLEQNGQQLDVVVAPIVPEKTITVVLDASHGGSDNGESYQGVAEKAMTLKIMRMVQEQLKKEDMRVFCTRNGDTEVSEQARVDFANTIKADMLVSVHYSFLKESDQDKKPGLTAIYNGKFFIPDFGSIELADIMSEETIKKVGGVANGMYEATEENYLVNGAHVPVALIEIDDIMTDANKDTLTSDKNLKRIAEGICAGVLKARDMLEQ